MEVLVGKDGPRMSPSLTSYMPGTPLAKAPKQGAQKSRHSNRRKEIDAVNGTNSLFSIDSEFPKLDAECSIPFSRSIFSVTSIADKSVG